MSGKESVRETIDDWIWFELLRFEEVLTLFGDELPLIKSVAEFFFKNPESEGSEVGVHVLVDEVEDILVEKFTAHEKVE